MHSGKRKPFLTEMNKIKLKFIKNEKKSEEDIKNLHRMNDVHFFNFFFS